jgi:hypothetical protein
MRFKEFFFEASIFTKPNNYFYGHKVNIGVGNKKGQILLAKIQDQIPDFDPYEELEWIPLPDDNYPEDIPEINFGSETSSNDRYFKRPDGQVFSISGADKSIQGALNHVKGQKGSTAENKGDASEPVLSAAVVAKLIKRGANNVQDITGDDVKHVLKQALQNPSLTYTVTDKNSRIADNIKFSIKVKEPIRRNLLDSDFWAGYETLLPSVVHYANSGQMDKYADYFYKYGKADTVSVVSDGVSDAKTRKTDVEAYVRDDHGNVRKLKGLNISLKAGSSYIGQIGGGSLNPKAKNHVLSNAQALFGPLGIDITAPKTINSKVEFWVHAYEQAEKQLNKKLKGKDAKTEAGVVYRLANFIASHATSNDPSIRLVSLSSSGLSSVHSFSGIERKLADKNINLECNLRIGTSKKGGHPRPELRIYDKTSNRPLVYIRYSSTETEDKVWNGIAMQDLLKELTTLKYNKDKSRETDTTPPPAPAPTSPEPSPQQTPPPPAPKSPTPQKTVPVAATKPVAPTKQQPDLSKSPLTAKWLNSR